ncbi:MAG: TerB family tellurite resistance protein [Deltaproteobacteria bacterium]|nr:TerB family tellurite resistance protein [Deltaproteobacteria bacterium]
MLGTLSIMAMPLVSAQTVQTSPSDMLWSVLITFTIAMICVAYGMMLALMPESRSGVVTLFIVYSTAVVAPIFGAMMVDVVWGSTAGAIAVFAFLFLSAPITYLASFGVRSSERLLMETLDPPSKDVPGVYRKLLADLLVRIMTCDTGKINAKERHHFIQVMHDMGMKQWMAQALIRQLDDPWQTWQDVVTEVIERGEELGQSTPDHILMERLVAAAKSDGVLNEEERAFLEMVGHQLGWTGDDVEDALLL